MSTRLFVGSLPYSVSDDDLAAFFKDAGEVKFARVITDRDSGRSKGFGFVEMGTDDEAKAAIDKFNNAEMEGRKIVVNEAKPRPPQDNR